MGFTCETVVSTVAATHEVADLNGGDAGNAVDQRSDFGEPKVQLRRVSTAASLA